MIVIPAEGAQPESRDPGATISGPSQLRLPDISLIAKFRNDRALTVPSPSRRLP
jgi:hypothetical protein